MNPFTSLGWVARGRPGALGELRTHHLVAGDGRAVARDRLEFPEAAVVVVVDDDEVVLVRQWRTGAGRALLECPAGLVEPGETPRACAARECEEEVGLVPGHLVPLGAWWPSPGISTERIWAFLATDLRAGDRRPDGPEEDGATVVRLPLDRATDEVRTGGITDMKTVAALALVGGSRG